MVNKLNFTETGKKVKLNMRKLRFSKIEMQTENKLKHEINKKYYNEENELSKSQSISRVETLTN